MSLTDHRANFALPTLGPLARGIGALSGWRRAAVSFALGAASVFSFAPFHLWPLLFLTLPAFVWLLDGIAERDAAGGGKPKWRQAAIAGWWFGFGFFAAGLYWVGFAFFVEADKFAVLAPLGVAAFPAALAIFFALACAAAIALWQPGVRRIFVFVAAFFAADWLRGHILTGFPWNLWGYALAGNEAIAQSTSFFGIYGLTLLTLLIFASPAVLAGPPAGKARRGWMLPVFCLALLAGSWGWGNWRLASASDELAADVRLRIVQGNIPQADKWKPENRRWIFDRLVTLSEKPADLGPEQKPITHLIWPETALPVLFMLNERILDQDVQKAFARLTGDDRTMILGAERVEGTKRGDGRYTIDKVFNSLFVLGADARVRDIYDKVHLVPFGEYLPFEETLTALGIKQLTHANTGFASGAARPVMETPGASSFLPLICYEAIFPVYTADADVRPGWLLNLTNDAWFGTSSGPYQHLHQTRLRAIETGLPLVRAANTGVSAIVDAYGRVRAQMPLNETGVIDHGLPVALEPTPYSRWGENCVLLVAFLIFLLYRITIKVE